MSSAERPEDPGAQLRSEEATLTRILSAKMKQQGCFQETDQESVAYRISEIMVAAKELYTKDLPRLMQEDQPTEMFSDLAGLRMTFFHLRDLITDFDEAFLDAMTHVREDGDAEEEDEEDGDDADQED
jgi:cytochrome c-type biogenesis protein CcmE